MRGGIAAVDHRYRFAKPHRAHQGYNTFSVVAPSDSSGNTRVERFFDETPHIAVLALA
jgi:hypothetical protein